MAQPQDAAEVLVLLVQAMREDPAFAASIRGLGEARLEDRQGLLKETAARMRERGVEEAAVKALESLRDPQMLGRLLAAAEAPGGPTDPFEDFFKTWKWTLAGGALGLLLAFAPGVPPGLRSMAAGPALLGFWTDWVLWRGWARRWLLLAPAALLAAYLLKR